MARLIVAAALGAALAIGAGGAARSQPAPPAAPVQKIDLKVSKIDDAHSRLQLGGALAVQVDGLDDALRNGQQKPGDFVLYLDGHAMNLAKDGKSTSSPGLPIGGNVLKFALTRTDDNKAAWTALFGSPQDFTVTLPVGVGVVSGVMLAGTPTAGLTVIWQGGFVLGVIILAVVLGLLLWLGRCSDLVRDSEPCDFAGATATDGKALRRPFSFAYCQMAWWFFIVLGAYLFLVLVTWEMNLLSAQALSLMGISVATAGLSAGVGRANAAAPAPQPSTPPPCIPALQKFRDVVKKLADMRAQGVPDAALGLLLAQRDALARQLASQDLFDDILTDADGISLHRFQAAVWTVVLGLIFLVQVYRNLAMPEFDANMLAVLGISSGAYVWFKVGERPA
jgi:hypothetical protein